MKRFIYAVVMILALAAEASAQTIIKVPYGSAHFAWDAGAPAASKGAADKHTIVCGTVTVDVPMPATSISVSSVIPGPGIYTCEIYASNAFGRQKEPNIPFPQFEAGLEPASPANPRLEVR